MLFAMVVLLSSMMWKMAASNADNTTASTFQDKIGSMPAFLKVYILNQTLI